MRSIRQAVAAAASLLAICAVVPSVANADPQSGASGDQNDKENKRHKNREKGEGAQEGGGNNFGKKQNRSNDNKFGGGQPNTGGFGKFNKTDDKSGDNNQQQGESFSKKHKRDNNKFGDQNGGASDNKSGADDKNRFNKNGGPASNMDNKADTGDKGRFNKYGVPVQKPDNKADTDDSGKSNFKKKFGNDKDRDTGDKPVVINPVDKGSQDSGGVQSDKQFSGRAKGSFDSLKSARKERTIEGGKGFVITEPGNRTIIKENNRIVIQHDERERLRKAAPNARFEKGKGGINVSIIDRGDVKIYSETDEHGQLIRRYRRGPDGRDIIIIDNRRRHRGGGLATGIGIGLGVAAGAIILDSMLDVPPLRIRIPRGKYIVDYDRASDEDVYEALSAPPVEESEERYSLDEIRATASLRDRMRRVDLDDVNFEFGSWEVDPSQYGKLERIARAMRRVIDRNPNEVFMIEGYTDAVGSVEDNLSLSDWRAESVAEVLTEQFKVPYENLTTQGYGEQYLKVETDGPERINRRVAVRRITPLLAHDNGPAAERGDYSGPDARGGDRDGPDDRGGSDDRDQPDPQDRGDDRDQGGRGDYQYRPYQGDQRN